MKSHPYILACLLFTACADSSSEYFPLGNAISWEYRTQKQTASDQVEGRLIVTQLARKNLDNITYYPFRYANGETVYFSKNDADIVFSPEPNQPSLTLMPFQTNLNANWQTQTRIELLENRHESFAGGESFISEDEEIILNNQVMKFNEKVTVPSGIFTETVRIDSNTTVNVKERTQGINSITIEESSWYAKGIGLIKKVRTEYSHPEKYRVKQTTELNQYQYL